MLGDRFLKKTFRPLQFKTELDVEVFQLTVEKIADRGATLRKLQWESRKDDLSEHPLKLIDGYLRSATRRLINSGDIALAIHSMEPLGLSALADNYRAAVRLKQLRGSPCHAHSYRTIGTVTAKPCLSIGQRLHEQKHLRAAFHFLVAAGDIGESSLLNLGGSARQAQNLRLAVECFSMSPGKAAPVLIALGNQLVHEGDLYFAAKAFTTAGHGNRSVRASAVGGLDRIDEIAQTLGDDLARHELHHHISKCRSLVGGPTPPDRFAFPQCLGVC